MRLYFVTCSVTQVSEEHGPYLMALNVFVSAGDTDQAFAKWAEFFSRELKESEPQQLDVFVHTVPDAESNARAHSWLELETKWKGATL